MYGWRGRIGLMIPSTVTTIDSEFHRLVPDGVSVHTTRMFHTKSTPEGLASLSDSIERAAEELATAHVNVIAFGCTSGGLLKGEKWEKEIRERIEKTSGIPAVTTIESVVEALQILGMNRVIVATPYVQEVNDLEKSFLEKKGVEVLGIRGIGIVESVEIGDQPPWVSYTLAKEVFLEYPQAGGIFISCTNFRTIEIIEKLEKDAQIPVVTSVQATLWNCLRKIHCNEPILGYGKLLRITDE